MQFLILFAEQQQQVLENAALAASPVLNNSKLPHIKKKKKSSGPVFINAYPTSNVTRRIQARMGNLLRNEEVLRIFEREIEEQLGERLESADGKEHPQQQQRAKRDQTIVMANMDMVRYRPSRKQARTVQMMHAKHSEQQQTYDRYMENYTMRVEQGRSKVEEKNALLETVANESHKNRLEKFLEQEEVKKFHLFMCIGNIMQRLEDALTESRKQRVSEVTFVASDVIDWYKYVVRSIRKLPPPNVVKHALLSPREQKKQSLEAVDADRKRDETDERLQTELVEAKALFKVHYKVLEDYMQSKLQQNMSTGMYVMNLLFDTVAICTFSDSYGE